MNSQFPVRRSGRRILTASASVAAAAAMLVGGAAAPAVAAPIIPDESPLYPKSDVVENPQITVTHEDGSPVTGPVHRGDVLVVHGTGFDPGANRGGFPLPVPPGVPNGVWVMYSAFPDHWKPSEDAPSETRTHPHDRMAWVMPPGTLEKVPGTFTNMRATLARTAQPMTEQGTFDARIVVDPPENTPGGNYGVYVYAAGGSVNAKEEIYVPIAFDPAPGPNTPPASSPDLAIEAGLIEKVADIAGGGIEADEGALKDGSTVTYSLVEDGIDPATGHGVVKYRGKADITARFSLVHVTVRDPWIESTPRGTVVTAEVSRRYDSGPDSTVRMPIAVLKSAEPGASGSAPVGPVVRNR
ncbi:HtaA protein [Corynebacterium sp. 335C]